MGEGRSRSLWNHTSSIWALFMDLHRKPGESAKFKLADFNPHMREHSRKEKQDIPSVSMRELHAMIPDLPDSIAAMHSGRKPDVPTGRRIQDGS